MSVPLNDVSLQLYFDFIVSEHPVQNSRDLK